MYIFAFSSLANVHGARSLYAVGTVLTCAPVCPRYVAPRLAQLPSTRHWLQTLWLCYTLVKLLWPRLRLRARANSSSGKEHATAVATGAGTKRSAEHASGDSRCGNQAQSMRAIRGVAGKGAEQLCAQRVPQRPASGTRSSNEEYDWTLMHTR